MEEERDMESEIRNLMKVWLSTLVSLCYCYYIVSKIPKGVTAFLLTWLGNSKLLLYAFDQGPLSFDHPKSFLHFLAIACLPIKIKPNPSPKSVSNPSATSQNPLKAKSGESSSLQLPKTSPLVLAFKVLLFSLMLRIYDYRPHLHQNLIMILYCGHVYLLLEIVLIVCSAPARALLGLEIEPQSNEPYFSTSLQDFWGRRWNLMVPSILRPTVYDPTRRIVEQIYGIKWALATAVLAAFLVSGLMHELIYFYVMRVAPTWEVTWFFVLHGVCTAVEIVIKKALTGRVRLNRAISGAFALGFVMVTAFWLFFPQILRNGVDIRAIGEYSLLVDLVRPIVEEIQWSPFQAHDRHLKGTVTVT
ncbi:hypothetical protein NE237_028705 [Protea cynaroides]|uniref:Wax synthase domain-containing protein n=1 Tax=Protea cynaroides TaxID=273540 RepID=A0A9Q0JVI8_9MAGN|nr:hypothetical protein NE237_028705 [Protea cynaroides]